jgi:hypothetical protein
MIRLGGIAVMPLAPLQAALLFLVTVFGDRTELPLN